MFSEKNTDRVIRGLLCFLLTAAALWLFAEYLLAPLLPFLIAYLLAACLQPVIRFLERKARFPRRLTVLLSVCLLVVLLLCLCWLICRRVSKEASALISSAEEFLDRLREDPDYAGSIAERIDGFVPFFDVREPVRSFLNDLDARLAELLSKAAGTLTGSLLPLLASLAAFIPNALLFLVVLLLAAYYFASDYAGFHAAVRSLLPAKTAQGLHALRIGLGASVAGFLRAYGLLMLITFSELFSALLVMGYRYAFLIALVTALIDILPVLGTGTVLIPWGILTILSGSTGRGVALLCVYAVMTVVRQIIEPRIVGKYIGVPPLLALAAMYVGLKLFGLVGLILFPLAALLLWKAK